MVMCSCRNQYLAATQGISYKGLPESEPGIVVVYRIQKTLPELRDRLLITLSNYVASRFVYM